MLVPEEELIRFTFHRTTNSFKADDYDPKLTKNRLPATKVQRIFARINKMIKTTQNKEKIYNNTLFAVRILWALLFAIFIIAFKRKRTSTEETGLSLIEINIYMALVFISLLVNFGSMRALNKLTDKNFQQIQKFLMDKNQSFMKSGYRWNIALPTESILDVLPPKRIYLTALEICKDYWSIDDFGLVDDETQDSIKFPFHVRENQFIFQFYTPKQTNFRISLLELSGFFGKVEQIFKSSSIFIQLVSVWIEAAWTVVIALGVDLGILFILKGRNQGIMECYILAGLIVFCFLSLKVSALIVNWNTRNNHRKIQEDLKTQNVVFRREKGISWKIGELIKDWKDPFTGDLLVHSCMQLFKDYKSGDNIFYSGQIDEQDLSFNSSSDRKGLDASSNAFLA